MTNCVPKKVHVPTQELLHRKKCLLPDQVMTHCDAPHIKVVFTHTAAHLKELPPAEPGNNLLCCSTLKSASCSMRKHCAAPHIELPPST